MKQYRPTNWQLIVSILSLITSLTVGVLGLILSNKVGNVESGMSDRGNSVRRVEKGVLANQFVISSPSSGADVSVDDKVVGNTPFPDMNHDILVAPVKTGAALVQDQPAVVNLDNGTFVGRARFGNTGVGEGEGEQFIVRVLASKSTLPVGPLTNSPADAVVFKLGNG